jgi:1-acyl-sn-glycerol-3-phosphate acyltransferase
MIRARLALACSIVLFVFVASFIALPDMWLARMRLKAKKAPEGELRRASSVRTIRWGERLSRWICSIMRIRTRFDMPERDDGEPAILIANHTGTFDVIAMLGFVPRTGRRDIRWVMKKETLSAPVIGTMARWVGCIPVSRNRDPLDHELIRQGALHAGEEGASPLIFPEGTRFDPAKTREGYMHVLPPRPGGFHGLREALPDYPVLDITIEWRPRLDAGAGKTMWSALDLYGRELSIRARRVEPEELDEPNWLKRSFQRKDRELGLM